MIKKKESIHVATPKAWDIKIEYALRDGLISLKKVDGRIPNTKTMINKYDPMVNKGRSNSPTFVIPQKKIDTKRTTPTINKRDIVNPFSPVYTFIILCLNYFNQ